MYSIETNRKLTPYIKSSVLVWVAEKIAQGGYKSYGKAAKQLLERVALEKNITEEQYEVFTDCFSYLPYDYVIQKGKMKSYIPRVRRNRSKIISNDVSNYLVDFKGFPVPLGFMKDFFEDDYELASEIKSLYTKYLEAACNEFSGEASSACIAFDKDVDNLRNTQSNIFPKKGRTAKQHIGRWWMHIVNLLKICLPLIAVSTSGNILMGYIMTMINGKFGLDILFKSMTAQNEKLIFVLNAVIFLLAIIPAIKAIGLIIFYILFWIVKLRVRLHIMVFSLYDNIIKHKLYVFSQSMIGKLSVDPIIKKEYSKAPMNEGPANPVLKWFYKTFKVCTFGFYRWTHKVVKVYTPEKITGVSKILKGKTWSKVNIITGKSKSVMGLILVIILAVAAIGVNTPQFSNFLSRL